MGPTDWTRELREPPSSIPDALRSVLGYAPSPATSWRWTVRGIAVETRDTDGSTRSRRVKLWSFRAGRRRLTTASAVREFLAATNPASAVHDVGTPDRGVQVDGRLRAAGLLGKESGT